MFHFYAPENIRKPLVFCFQGVQKLNIGLKCVNVTKVNIQNHMIFGKCYVRDQVERYGVYIEFGKYFWKQ